MTNDKQPARAYLLAKSFRRGRRNVHARRVRSPEKFGIRASPRIGYRRSGEHRVQIYAASSFIRHSLFVIRHSYS